MKFIKLKYIVLFLAAINIIACQNEFLELEPKVDKLDANAYATEDDAFLALVTIYDAMSHQEVLNFQPYRSDIYSDDTFTGGEPPSGGMASRWQVMELSIIDAETPTSEEVWRRCYRGSYNAMLYLNKEADIKWQSEDKRKRFAAEAKFLTAYFYWDLVRHFGWAPIVDQGFISGEKTSIVQNTPFELYTFIAKNLLEAITDLPETVTPNEYGRATKAAAQVLMARIYLYYHGFAVKELGVTGEWTDGTTTIDKTMVTAALEEVISKGNYVLLNNYADVHDWDNENNAESIFEIQYSEKSNFSSWDNTHMNNGNTICHISAPRNPKGDSTAISGWSFGMLTWSLVNEFESGDPRYNTTVYEAENELYVIDNNSGDTLWGWENGGYTPGFHNTTFFNKKYQGRMKYRSTEAESVHNYPKNHIDMRYAEVYLLLAELYIESNNARATELLNTVRTRSMGSGAALASITLDDLIHEKRVEFACEGLRYWDLLRWGLDYAKEKIDASYVPDPLYPAPDEFTGYYFDKGHKGMLPIPASQILSEDEGVLEQKIDFYK